MRGGRRLGIGVGSVRVGVATCDPPAPLAHPLTTLATNEEGGDVAEIARLAAELDVIEIILGLPRSLDGSDGPAAVRARRYAPTVAGACPTGSVRLVDERPATGHVRPRPRRQVR